MSFNCFRIFVFLFFLLLSTNLFSNDVKGDSITKTSLQQKVDSLRKEHKKYARNNPKRAFELVHEALAIADSIRYIAGKVNLKIDLGTLYRTTGNFNESLKYSFEALNMLKMEMAKKTAEEQPLFLQEQLGKIYLNIGNLYASLSYFSLAMKYYEKSEQIFKTVKTMRSLAVVYISKANVHFENDDPMYAKDQYLKSLTAMKKLKEKRIIALLYGNIAHACHQLGEYEVATAYVDSASAMNRAQENDNSLGQVQTLKAEIEFDQQKYDSSLSTLDAALKQLEKANNRDAISSNNVIRGLILMKMGKLDLAEKILVKTLEDAQLSLFAEQAKEACEHLIELYTLKKDTANILKFKSLSLDLRIAQEKQQDTKALVEEKYARQFDEQAELFDFREALYKKSNNIVLAILGFLGLQLLILLALRSRKKPMSVTS